MTPTTVTPPRHRAPNTEHRAVALAKDIAAALFAVAMFFSPMLIVGTIIVAALLAGGGR